MIYSEEEVIRLNRVLVPHSVKVRTKPMTLLGIIFVKGSLDDK